MRQVSRREFIRTAGGAVVTLYLTQLGCRGGKETGLEEIVTRQYSYGGWLDLYRQEWTWDRVARVTHYADCYPGACTWLAYVKDGMVWREEQGANYPVVEPGVPDMNPRGCQKGACHSDAMYGPERLKYPLRRVGERGSGRWQRVSWDEALTEIADGFVRAVHEAGADSIIIESGPGNGNTYVHSPTPSLPGATTLDIDGLISDFNVGIYETFGKFHFVSSVDDWFHADLILIWHMNPTYTRIPSAHYINEARYKGAEVVSIAPDYNASSIHADLWVPVEPGTDAALGLAMAKVIIDEGLYHADFIKEQTDLPLLVRTDTRRYLRQIDLTPDGSDDQLYLFDRRSGEIVEAPRGSLDLGDMDPALEGTFEVSLADGSRVQIVPVFSLLKERLEDYTPQKAARVCGVRPQVITSLARKVARAGAVHILVGWNACKYYHGDLMERAMCLLLALTGNWGRKGTGIRGWNTTSPTGSGAALERLKAEDPTMTDELAAIEIAKRSAMGGRTMPPAFYWYYHAGYRDIWNRGEWSDQSMRRSLDSYVEEAIEKGWWPRRVERFAEVRPQVLFVGGTSPLRRTRGGFKQLLQHLWPKLDLIVTTDWRMSTTAHFSDIVLPAAGHYEKMGWRFFTFHVPFLTWGDRAVEPVGDSKPEAEIWSLLAEKIRQRAEALGLAEYQDSLGNIYRFDSFRGGAYTREREENAARAIVSGAVGAGFLPQGTTVETFRESGIVRATTVGLSFPGLIQASEIRPDETHSPLRWHLEKKFPYPTLSRRAQFYIDHEWFLEAGEELPTHKPNPKMGGEHPFVMTSGHQRWSIHSFWAASRLMLYTHRGHPSLFMNPRDASRRGIGDDDEVRVHNDLESFTVRAKLSPAVRPGQVIIYHAWEPYQFKDWKPYDIVIPGMVKWLHFAGGYEQFRFHTFNWQPQQVDRAVAVDVARA